MKSVTELRDSQYHQELARKMCAAIIAQQQGIGLETALKKVPDAIADAWLLVAEFAIETWGQDIYQRFDGFTRRCRGPVM